MTGPAGPPDGVPHSARIPRAIRTADFLPIVVATLIWAWPMIFIRYIKARTGGAFPEDALNLYRYASAAAAVLALVACTRPGDLLAVLRRWPAPLALAAILATFQTIWVRGVYLVPASYGTLVGRSSIVFALLLGYAFFADERRVIRSGRFLLSAAAATAAVAGVIACDRKFALRGALFTGTMLFLVSALIWAAYAVTIRRLVRGLPPMATFAVTVALTTLLLLPAAVVKGGLGVMWSSPWNVQLAVFFSGAACVGATQMLYYVSLKRIGVAYTSLVGLSSPFLTGVFAYLVLGREELLSPWQWAFGAALVASLGYMVWSSAGIALPAPPSPQASPVPGGGQGAEGAPPGGGAGGRQFTEVLK